MFTASCCLSLVDVICWWYQRTKLTVQPVCSLNYTDRNRRSKRRSDFFSYSLVWHQAGNRFHSSSSSNTNLNRLNRRITLQRLFIPQGKLRPCSRKNKSSKKENTDAEKQKWENIKLISDWQIWHFFLLVVYALHTVKYEVIKVIQVTAVCPF